MHISFQALVLAALSLEGALGQPAHRHQHKHRRDLADVLGKRQNFDDPSLYVNVNWKEVCANGGCDGSQSQGQGASSAGSAPAVTPTSVAAAAPNTATSSTPTSAAPASSSSVSSSGSTGTTSGSTGSCSNLESVWTSGDTSMSAIGKLPQAPANACAGGCTSADGQGYSSFSSPTQPKSDGTPADYQGNVGTTYGHNMYPLSDCDVSSQLYSITFTNAATSQIQVALWNKVGDNYQTPGNPGPITGAFRNAFFKFPLEGGQSASFAVDANSQVAFSQACDRSEAGSFDCTWGEADFGNESNGGYSGYDRSSIPNSAGNTGLLSVCVDGHDCSTQTANNFVSVSQDSAGGNLVVGPNQQMHLKVSLGG